MQQAGGAGATLARDASVWKFAPGSFLCTPNGTIDQGMVPTNESFLVAVAPSTVYTMSAYILAAAGRVHRFAMSQYSAGPVFISNQFSPSSPVGNGTWQRLTFTFTTGGTTTLIGATIGAAEATTSPFNVDGIKLEVGSKATNYVEKLT